MALSAAVANIRHLRRWNLA